MSNDYFMKLCITMDTNDLFVPIGWCPEKVKVTKLSDGQDLVWFRIMGNDASIERVAAGDRTVNSDKGIKLVKFTDDPLDMSADLTAYDANEGLIHANGIWLTADIAFLADDNVVMVEAWRAKHPVFKITHDGATNNTHIFEDRSYDFKELGVGDNQSWICYNQSNGNYAYISHVVKPAGQNKHCQLYLSTSDGTATTAADIDTSDVAYIYPVDCADYPISDIGLMT